jgi:DNA polymerase-3 subunit gamma/tau
VQTSDKPVVKAEEIQRLKTLYSNQISVQPLNQNTVQVNEPLEEFKTTPTEDVPLTNERAQNAVRNFAEEKSKTGNKQLYATLTSSKISLTDTTITIEINNEVQKELLSNIKQDLLDALRSLLSNRQTLLNIIVSEIAGEVKAYKPDDKFKMMAEKNPALLELKRRFDLNVEY